MSLIEDELANAFHGRVKRKANTTRKLRVSAKRVASGSSEVMVKITGFGKGAAHVKSHLEYVTRNAKLEMENDRGEVFSDKEQIKAFFNDWKKEIGDEKRHKEQRDTMHMVLSMPESVDPEAVRAGTREFAKAAFGKNHEYVFTLHTDQPHPHCHLTVKCKGFDGRRLNPRKADLEEWRQLFAEKMRDQGIDAEATPRYTRGVVKRAERNVVRHIEQGDKTHAPRVSKVKAAKVKEAARELVGEPAPARPWEPAIRARQRKVRQAWLNAADELEKIDTRKTFNGKEPSNERPNYAGLDPTRTRATQRAAAVYQSNLEKSGPAASPRSVASVRNLSGIPLVQHQRVAKVLLPENAHDFMGGKRRPNPEMRRPRAGDSRALGGVEPTDGLLSTADANKALAGRIRAFVAAMPALDTERDQLKRALGQQFAKQPEKIRDLANQPAPVPQSQADGGKDVSIAAPKQRNRDLER